MIFVTGATGFVGRHVVEALQRSGLPLRALARPGNGASLRERGVEVVCGSIERDDSYDEALRGVDAVVHLASKNVDDGLGFTETNVEGTRKLAEAAARRGVGCLVYLSSVGVYGHGSFVDATEEQPAAPDTPLSRSKLEAERVLTASRQRFAVTILRPRFIHGPGDRHFVPRLASALRRRRVFPVSGRARMSLVHAADLAEVIVRCCAPPGRPGATEIYHVNDGRPHTVGSVFGSIASALGVPAPVFVPVPPALLYYPMRAYEQITRADPEDPRRGVTSLRLKFLAQNSAFSNRALRDRFPDLRFRDLGGDLCLGWRGQWGAS